MKQRPIDLLPDSIRARSQAGIVAGRYVIGLLTAVLLVGLTATHSRLMLDLAHQRLRVAEEQADIVLAAEDKAETLRQRLQRTRAFTGRYEKVAPSLQFSRVVATIINLLPASASIDRLDLRAGVRRDRRTRRSPDEQQEPPKRVLAGEVSGIAATDHDVARFVADLEGIGVFEHVSLDFSRTREVNDKPAREFRVSFRGDLEVRYEVLEPEGMRAEEAAHVE